MHSMIEDAGKTLWRLGNSGAVGLERLRTIMEYLISAGDLLLSPWLLRKMLYSHGLTIHSRSTHRSEDCVFDIETTKALLDRSAGLLQDKSFSKFLIENGPSPEGYVYAFQLAVLAVLAFIATALVLIMGGIGIYTGNVALNDAVNRGILFFVGSVAVRESWGIIYFVNKLTIQYYRVREQELLEEARKAADGASRSEAG